MNRWFAALRIRNKLIALIVATTAVVVLLASIGHLLFQYWAVRDDATRDLEMQGRLVLEAAAAPLAFDRRDELRATLETLDANLSIRATCLYDGTGTLVEQLRAPDAIACPPAAPSDGVVYEANRIAVTVSSFEGTQRTGTIYIRSDLGALRRRVRDQAIIIAVVMVVALGVAGLVSARLQRLVSEPIVELSDTASAIASGGDYSLRAQRRTDDEIGILVDAFNGMLGTIQSRELALSRANEELRHEVAERRRAEQERAELLVREREANRVKDEFLATLSHELRTPLNAILGWTKLLRGNALPPDGVDRALEKVERNAQVQARLVEDLLEVSRITTGKLRLEVREFDLVAVAARATDSIRPAAEARGVRLEQHFEPHTMLTTGDPDRMQQVIWNLLSNAVKFTPAGGTTRIAIRRAGGEDEIVVSDTGVGIEPEFLPHVFDTFRQADASATRAYGGLGLGLAIVRNLVELHGGSVTATSQGRDKGSEFTVRLPVRAPRREVAAAPAVTPGWLPSGALTGTTILAVDDDTDTRELLQSVLEAAGARVFAAASVEDALLAVQERRPDAIVSDIGMPGRDGYELLQEVRALLGDRSPRVAVALSAYAGEQDRQRSAAAGYQQHVAKPVDPAALVQILRQLLESSAPSR